MRPKWYAKESHDALRQIRKCQKCGGSFSVRRDSLSTTCDRCKREFDRRIDRS